MELQELVKAFEINQSEILQAYEKQKSKIISNYESKKSGYAKNYEKSIKIANKSVGDDFEKIKISMDRVVGELTAFDCSDKTTVLKVAEYLNLGIATFSGKECNSHNDITIPLLVPFLGHSNIFLTTETDDKCSTIRELIFRTMTQTAPGQLELIVYDPNLTQIMAPFSSLNGDEINLKVIHNEGDFAEILNELTKSITDIENQMQNMFVSIVDYRRKAEQPIGKYYAVAVLDFTEKLDERVYNQLKSIMKVSAKAGVSFILNCDKKHFPEFVNIKELKEYCYCLKKISQYIILENVGCKCTFEMKEIPEIVSAVSEYVKKAENMKGTPVEFSSIVPESDNWNCSSVDGIVFPIGKEGLSDASISLGDELNQRHNAIITGAVGQGKSNLIKVIVHSICSKYSPNEVNLYLLDFKEGVTLAPFSNIGKSDYLPHAKVLGLESDRIFGVNVLKYIIDIMDKRNEEFRKNGCENISKYRKKNPDALMPRIVLIIDEFYFMFNTNDNVGMEASEYLETIARKGRSSGIHIILASQTISGASALIVKQDGIFGQFPIRVALKNNINESYATLSHGNDGAARLKIRGQAVINNESGRIGFNKIATVAWAPDEYFDKIRKTWWNKVKAISEPPVSFVGTAYCFISEALPLIMQKRKAVLSGSQGVEAVVGMPLSVEQVPVCINMEHSTGRNVAVFGSGENKLSAGDGVPTNNAVGIMQSMALSIALQHNRGDARFIILNLLDKIAYEKNNMSLWIDTMRQIGFEIEIIERKDVPLFIINTAESLTNKENLVSTYIFGFAMEQATNLHIEDPDTYETPSERFGEILSRGSSQGVHFFGCWNNIQAYEKLVKYDLTGYFETKIVLHLDKKATADLIGYGVEWETNDNRALISDQGSGKTSEIIIPFAPLREEDADNIKKKIERRDIY